jgi:hypothetical protein
MKICSKKVTSQDIAKGIQQENSSFPCSGYLLACDDFILNPKEASIVVGFMSNFKEE